MVHLLVNYFEALFPGQAFSAALLLHGPARLVNRFLGLRAPAGDGAGHGVWVSGSGNLHANGSGSGNTQR